MSAIKFEVIPPGVVADYAGSVAPDGWLLCFGQAISRTGFAPLFAAIGTAYGAGDGSSTFTLPDCRGRVVAGKDNMGGTNANRLSGGVSGGMGATNINLGGVGGEPYHSLTLAELAAHSHTAPSHVHNNPNHLHYTSTTHTHTVPLSGYYLATTFVGSNVSGSGYNLLATPAGSPSFTTNASPAPGWSDAGYGATTSDAGDSVKATTNTGSNSAHNVVQPTIILNKIIHI